MFELLPKYESAELRALAPLIREVAKYVPSRRRRKLHLGLFGYSREVNALALPRAIKFTASLYSIGVPPELLGLSALSESKLERVSEYYKGLYRDLSSVLMYFNPRAAEKFKFLKPIADLQKELGVEPMEEHEAITMMILSGELDEGLIVEAAGLREFLG